VVYGHSFRTATTVPTRIEVHAVTKPPQKFTKLALAFPSSLRGGKWTAAN
jgi:hypothetical protein